MKTARIITLLSVIIVVFVACKRDNFDEGDWNTYTWRGRLVKDCNEEPVRNTKIWLEAAYSGTPDDSYEKLVETTTDEDGYFTLTYKKIRKVSAYGVDLYMQSQQQYLDNPLLTGPVNGDVYRDVALNQCHLLHFVINNKSGVDSLYLLLGKVYDNSLIKYVYVDEEDNYPRPSVALFLGRKDIEVDFKVESFLAQSWDNSPKKYTYSAAITMEEMKKISEAINVGNSSFYSKWEHDYQISGYPIVDTVYLEI